MQYMSVNESFRILDSFLGSRHPRLELFCSRSVSSITTLRLCVISFLTSESHLRARCESATMDVENMLPAGDFVMNTTAAIEDLMLSADMAGTFMTPEEFAAADDWK
jgi:hypothetical protein